MARRSGSGDGRVHDFELVLPPGERLVAWFRDGSLSGRIGSLPEVERQQFHDQIAPLPDSIGLIGPRTLVPIMAALRTPRRLNYLSAEALALAIAAEATIAVRTDSPLLREPCEALSVDYQLEGAR